MDEFILNKDHVRLEHQKKIGEKVITGDSFLYRIIDVVEDDEHNYHIGDCIMCNDDSVNVITIDNENEIIVVHTESILGKLVPASEFM